MAVTTIKRCFSVVTVAIVRYGKYVIQDVAVEKKQEVH